MTEIQKEMAGKVSSILSEHFGHALVVLSNGELEEKEYISLRFYGGALTAAGMAEYAKTVLIDMLSEGSGDPSEFDDEDGEGGGEFHVA